MKFSYSNLTKRSLHKSHTIVLKFSGERNFWDFYVKNQDSVDVIIAVHLIKYANRGIDLEDLKQDLLMTMQRREILTDFDPNKSKINTYITNYVKLTLITLVREVYKKGFRQGLIKSLNASTDGNNSEFRFYDADIFDRRNPPPDEEINFEEEIIALDKRISHELSLALHMRLEGFTATQVAEARGVSTQMACQRFNEIKRIFLAIQKGRNYEKIFVQ
jgi:hypothetical protein